MVMWLTVCPLPLECLQDFMNGSATKSHSLASPLSQVLRMATTSLPNERDFNAIIEV